MVDLVQLARERIEECLKIVSEQSLLYIENPSKENTTRLMLACEDLVWESNHLMRVENDEALEAGLGVSV